jgi:hypothetical protein
MKAPSVKAIRRAMKPRHVRALRRTRATLRRILTKARRDGYLGWDSILAAVERALYRSGMPGLFRSVLRSIDSLNRRYEGYKMHVETAMSPASMSIDKIDRVLGEGRRRPRRRRWYRGVL